jgi:uncharacterized protein
MAEMSDAPPASPFHVMLKPIGPVCNLACTYCYYLSKGQLLNPHACEEASGGQVDLDGLTEGCHTLTMDGKVCLPGHTLPATCGTRCGTLTGKSALDGLPAERRISDEHLEDFIRQYIDAHRHLPEIAFAWQGGEPTLMGLDFFGRAVELQKKYAPPGSAISNSIQTNGTLLDDAWGEFFARHRFLVGLSLDGPRDLHDAYRLDKGGRPTFDRVMAGLEILRKHRVEFNALVVVNRRNATRPVDVYRFLRDQAGVRFMQFIPCVERTDFATVAPQHWPVETMPTLGEPTARPGAADSIVTPWTVGPDDFGALLCGVFDEWLKADVGRVFVQTFDVCLGQWMGLGSSLCVFAPTCGSALAMERDGSLYACDHYVYPEFRRGRLDEAPLAEMVRCDAQRKFGQDKSDTLPRHCRECEVRFACNGECPKNRFVATPDGEPGLNYLCAGYRAFFLHVDGVMRLMAARLHAGGFADEVMTLLRNAPRNEACPCGSGRKAKLCHAR